MNIRSIFNDAFDYAEKMFADLGRLVILIVLTFIPLVNLVVLGYFAKVIRETPSSEPPALKGYGEMWIQGLKIAVASIIWMIVPIILGGCMALAFIAPIPLSGAKSGALIVLGMIGIGVAVLVAVVVAFMISIILSMAIVHMIKHNSFSKAFSVREILDIIRRIGWGKYIFWLIIMFVIYLVISAIGFIPLVGWLISLIIGPPFSVFAASSASLIYSEGVSMPTQPSGAKYCGNCGESPPSGAAFCGKRGQKV